MEELIPPYLEQKILELEAEIRERDVLIAYLSTGSALPIIIGPLLHELSHKLAFLDLLIDEYESSTRMTKPKRQLTPRIRKELDDIRSLITSTHSLYQGRDKVLWLHDLPDLFNKVRTMLSRSAVAQGTEMAFSVDFMETRKLKATESSLLVVLLNLISNSLNAIQEQRKQGMVRVSIQVGQDLTKLKVWDNGHGINESQLQFLTDPMYTTRLNHAGIGLTISRDLVRGWGGELTIHSSELEFTEVEITL